MCAEVDVLQVWLECEGLFEKSVESELRLVVDSLVHLSTKYLCCPRFTNDRKVLRVAMVEPENLGSSSDSDLCQETLKFTWSLKAWYTRDPLDAACISGLGSRWGICWSRHKSPSLSFSYG